MLAKCKLQRIMHVDCFKLRSQMDWRSRSVRKSQNCCKLKFLDFEQPTACWKYNFSILNSEKRNSEQKFIKQTLFPVKSTTLNPMVKSDLVETGDGTYLISAICLCSGTMTLSVKMFFTLEVFFLFYRRF